MFIGEKEWNKLVKKMKETEEKATEKKLDLNVE